jgi:uncharacterized protein YjbI with pentapeptide repeats
MNERSLLTTMLRRYLSLAPLQAVALSVGLGWLILFNLQAFRYVVDQSQQTHERIDAMWSIVTAPGTAAGPVSRKQAIEYLHAQGQSLQRVDLKGASLARAKLPGANLKMAILAKAALENANLRSADLWRATLIEARLSGASLRNTRLQGARLMHARLDRADLRGGDLAQADLTGADLRGARVTWEQLAKACGDPRSPPRVDKDVRPPTPWPRPCPKSK